MLFYYLPIIINVGLILGLLEAFKSNLAIFRVKIKWHILGIALFLLYYAVLVCGGGEWIGGGSQR